MATLQDAWCPHSQQQCAAVHSGDDHARYPDIFFAYPSQPPEVEEILDNAIHRTALEYQASLRVLGWKDLEIEGNIIFCQICQAIRQCKCIVADITHLNFNVLFEIGFAIGCGKRVWPLVKASEQAKHTHARLQTLTTIGYSTYRNSKDITTKLIKKQAWTKTTQLRAPTPIQSIPTRSAHKLLYLSSPSDNEASLRISEAVEASHIDLILDDPLEVSFQPLSWYLEKIDNSSSMLVDIGTIDPDTPDNLHMAKAALVAGIAVSSGRNVLIVANGLSSGPIDFRDLLVNYKNAAHAASLVNGFLKRVREHQKTHQEHIRYDITPPAYGEQPLLDHIHLGDYLAENELTTLQDYYIETPYFQDALKPGFKVFTGRKGTGKSALVFMAAERLQNKTRSVVKILSPKIYELSQILELTRQFAGPTHPKLLESLWKYMLATEALTSIADHIAQKPLDVPRTPTEEAVEAFVVAHPELHTLSFASRLVQLVQRQQQSAPGTPLIPETQLISTLHRDTLATLNNLICSYCSDEDRRIVLMVDGLVPTWDTVEDRQRLAEIFLSHSRSPGSLERMGANHFTASRLCVSDHPTVLPRGYLRLCLGAS